MARTLIPTLLLTVAVAAGACSSSGSAVGSRQPANASPPSRLTFDQRMLAVGFADPTHGLLIVENCASHPCRVGVYGTNDGGRHWDRRDLLPAPVAVPPSWAVMELPLPAVAVLEVGTGTARPAGYATHDAGRSWHRLTLPARAQLAATGGRRVWAYTTGCHGQPIPRCNGRLYSATVSGDGAFTLAGNPPTAGLPISGLVSAGGTLYLTAGAEGGPSHRVLVSSDGGRSWRIAPDPCGRDGLAISAPPGNSSVVWTTCYGEPGAGMQQKRLFISTDQARSWTRRPDPERGGYSVGLAVATPSVAWRFGNGRAEIYRTGNGGRTWRDTLRNRVGDSAGGQQCWFDAVDSDHAWIIIGPTQRRATPSQLRTTDGGKTWTRTDLQV